MSFLLTPSIVYPKDNVVVHEDGHAALCDLGLSRLSVDMHTGVADDRSVDESQPPPSTGLTHTVIGGTLRYLAPELLESPDCRPTLASDMYAFGCTCAEVCTGSRFLSSRSLISVKF